MPEPIVPTPPIETPTPTPPTPPAPPETPPAEMFTKAQLDAAAAAARKADKADLDAGKAAIARLAELEAANLTATEKAEKLAADAKADAEAARAELATERTNALKMRIGIDKGLPTELAARLAGEDEATITLDADKMLAAIKAGATAPGARPGGPTDGDPFLQGLLGTVPR